MKKSDMSWKEVDSSMSEVGHLWIYSPWSRNKSRVLNQIVDRCVRQAMDQDCRGIRRLDCHSSRVIEFRYIVRIEMILTDSCLCSLASITDSPSIPMTRSKRFDYSRFVDCVSSPVPQCSLPWWSKTGRAQMGSLLEVRASRQESLPSRVSLQCSGQVNVMFSVARSLSELGDSELLYWTEISRCSSMYGRKSRNYYDRIHSVNRCSCSGRGKGDT